MTTITDLTGSGAPTIKFPNIGDTITGKVVDLEQRQATDLDGNPKTWDNGDPIMQWVITLHTDQHDPDIDGDDGTRRLYTNGGKQQGPGGGKRMWPAIVDAIRASGHKDSIEGGTLTVRYTEDGEAPKVGYTAPKLFKARYEPPATTVDDLNF